MKIYQYQSILLRSGYSKTKYMYDNLYKNEPLWKMYSLFFPLQWWWTFFHFKLFSWLKTCDRTHLGFPCVLAEQIWGHHLDITTHHENEKKNRVLIIFNITCTPVSMKSSQLFWLLWLFSSKSIDWKISTK